MDNFVPDIYQKSIYDINYKKLKKNGIKCLIFDLNNTIASFEEEYPTEKLREKMFDLEKSFKVIIMSNSNKDRVRPFKERLNIDSAFSSKKPFKKKYKKILNTYNYKDTEIAVIGDFLLTDIYGGNRMGFTTILVNPISSEEPFNVRIARRFEKRIIKKLNKKGILILGEYYE